MDKKLLEQRARAFDYLFDAIVVTDNDGMIIDWNPGAEKLYGYKSEEVLGKPVKILHVPEDMDRITGQVFVALKQRGHWSGEIKMQHKNGEIGWIESVVIPLYDGSKEQIGTLGIYRDITQRIVTEEKLHKLAYYDQLTGIPNRTILFDRLDQLLAQARRHKLMFALLFIDIDEFKIINDTAGHAVGDEALQETARRMRAAIRETDTVARVGGDEFVVLAPDIKQMEDARRVAAKLNQALDEPFRSNGYAFSIQSSIGIAIYPRDGKTRDSLLTFADHTMYENKRKKKENSAE